MKKIFYSFDRLFEKLITFFLVSSIGLILFLSIQGIVLRWFDISYPSIAPFVRHLVFIATFLGGAIATGRKNHIGIDILTKYLEAKSYEKAIKMIDIFINSISFLALLWLIYASFKFFQMESEFGKIDFFGIHSKYLVAIIPSGFSLIAYRFFFLVIDGLIKNNTKEVC